MTLGELKTLFSNTLNRSDATTAQIEQWIAMGLRRIQRKIKIPSQEASNDYTISGSNELTIPSDLIAPKGLYCDATDGGQLEQISYGMYMEKKVLASDATVAGVPQFFARKGGKYVLWPEAADGTVVTLLYWAEHEDMLTDTDENTLARIAPDLLVYMGLLYAGNFFLDERTGEWDKMASIFAQELQDQADESEVSSSRMRVGSVYRNAEY